MSNWDSIAQQRWFMGKGRKVSGIREHDSFNLGGTKVSIVEVRFENGERDRYSIIEDESRMGAVLAEYFGESFSRDTLLHAKALNAEQSNSAFYSKGEFFFKLYRRLQAGRHPEAEILEHLSKKAALGEPKISPDFYGTFCHTDAKTQQEYDIGILEEHIPDAKNAWEIFTDTSCTDSAFYEKISRDLGRTTAAMHKALNNLAGTAPQPEEVPYDKLISLLKANGRGDLVERVESIRAQQEKATPDQAGDSKLAPQRIHGDYHLGQLLYKEGKFTVLDFEGEPTRTLEYRRRLHSPAIDIAGMLRSFAYASAVRKDKDFEQIAAEAFLLGYSEKCGIPVPQLKKEASPYVLGKAIYEACYELEFRPDWFWIPEQLLI